MLKYNYWKWESQLSSKMCSLILKETDWDNVDKAKVGSDTLDLNKRKAEISWASPISVIGCICNQYAIVANKVAGWNFDLTTNQRVQMTKYNSSGDFYGWHMDSFEPVEGKQRKLSVSILLNEDFEGGEFDFENDENVLTKKGSILVFPSFLQHQVRPVTKGTRYSAVNWIEGEQFK